MYVTSIKNYNLWYFLSVISECIWLCDNGLRVQILSVCPGTIPSLPGDIGARADLTEPGDDRLACLEASESLVSLPLLTSSPLLLWVFTCLDKWSDLINRLLQIGQANLFSPVWVLRCLCSSSDLVNRLPQNSQLQTKGLSPVCHLKWALRWEVLPYILPQPGMWQLCKFFFLRWLPAGPSLSASWQLGQSQTALPVYLLWDLGEREPLPDTAWPRAPNWEVWPKREAWLPSNPFPAARPRAEAAL